MSGQVRHEALHRFSILNQSLIKLPIDRAINEDRWDLMLFQVAYGAVIRVGYMRQDHPVDPPFMQRTNYLQLVVGLVRSISKKKKVTATGTFGLHAAHHFTKINVSDR